jgi:hypothetical protein
MYGKYQVIFINLVFPKFKSSCFASSENMWNWCKNFLIINNLLPIAYSTFIKFGGTVSQWELDYYS